MVESERDLRKHEQDEADRRDDPAERVVLASTLGVPDGAESLTFRVSTAEEAAAHAHVRASR